MKLQFRVAGTNALGYQTLADESAGDVIRDWSPDATLNSNQRENLAVAVGQNNNSYRQPLGNISTKLSLNITVTKAGEAAAAQWARLAVTTFLGSKTHLKACFGTYNGTRYQEEQLFNNAVCSHCRAAYQGSTVELTIDFETDLVVDTTQEIQ